MDWAHHQPQFRFDIRAEREECERLANQQASVLMERMARRGHTDRTRKHATPEWEKVSQAAAQEKKLMHQARVLSWGKQKQFYFAHEDPT